jgi:hypothetical protein
VGNIVTGTQSCGVTEHPAGSAPTHTRESSNRENLSSRIIEKASKKEKILGLDTHQDKSSLVRSSTESGTKQRGSKKKFQVA